MSGITLERKILTEKLMEEEYEMTKNQQTYYRTQLGMPYCKVGKKYYYNRRDIDNWIISFKNKEKENV